MLALPPTDFRRLLSGYGVIDGAIGRRARTHEGLTRSTHTPTCASTRDCSARSEALSISLARRSATTSCSSSPCSGLSPPEPFFASGGGSGRAPAAPAASAPETTDRGGGAAVEAAEESRGAFLVKALSKADAKSW